MARIRTTEELIYDTNETVVKTGKRVSDTVVAEHGTTREVVIKTARKVADRSDANHNETRETIVKTGRKATDEVNAYADDLHKETRRNSDKNADRVIDAVNESNGIIAGWKIFVAIILAALAGWGTYVASKGYILKDIYDAAGNVVGQEPYLPYIILLVILAVVAAFFVVAAILSSIGRRR